MLPDCCLRSLIKTICLVSKRGRVEFVGLTGTGRGTSVCGVNSAGPISTCEDRSETYVQHAENWMPRTESQVDDNVHRSEMRREITVRVREVCCRLTLVGILVARRRYRYGSITQVLVSTVLPGVLTWEGTDELPRSQK